LQAPLNAAAPRKSSNFPTFLDPMYWISKTPNL
jgi:hypothetical protein